MKRLAIIGAGDLGTTLVAQLSGYPDYTPVAFFDDSPPGDAVGAVPVVGGLAEVAHVHGRGGFDEAVMAIGYKHLGFRAELFERLCAQGIVFATLIHPTCHVAGSAKVAAGGIVFPGCTLDVGVRVDNNTLLNTGCTVAHDSHIGAHSFLGPGVTIAGYVTVGQRCMLGVGSTLIDNVVIGDGAQTGGGAVVIGDIEAGALAVGVPARKIRTVR